MPTILSVPFVWVRKVSITYTNNNEVADKLRSWSHSEITFLLKTSTQGLILCVLNLNVYFIRNIPSTNKNYPLWTCVLRKMP